MKQALDAQETECETVRHVRPPISQSACVSKSHFDRRRQAAETIQFTIDILNKLVWRAVSLPVQVMAPMAGRQERHAHALCTHRGEGCRRDCTPRSESWPALP